MERNKIIYGGQTLIDLTDATATASDILSGKTAYGADGSLLVGIADSGSEWTSGIYMDDDDYIRVSPIAGAGGVYYDKGYLYFVSEQESEIPGIYGKWVVLVSENLHDPADDVADTYINLGGDETVYNGWTSTDYIPVKPNTLYLVKNHPGDRYNALYKSDKTSAKSSLIIPAQSSNGYSFIKTTNNTSYIRMSSATSSLTNVEIYETAVKIPEGTLTVTTNGNYLISEYENLTVNVAGEGESAVLDTKTITQNGTYSAEDDELDGYSEVVVNVPSGTPTLQSKTVTPTTSQQSVTPDTGYDGLSSVTVNAMPSGTAGTPTVTKGTVSRNAIPVTPSVTNTAGYISGGTKTGTALFITASELVSGSETKTQNGTYDVTNLAEIVVDVPATTPSLQSKTATPTESQQTISPDSGYDGLSSVTVDAISSTYVGSDITRRTSSDLTASGSSVTVPAGYYASQASKSVSITTHNDPLILVNSSTGLITASHSTGSGYVSSGTTSATEQLSVQAAKTVTPSTSTQTAVAAGKYTTGEVKVGPIPSNYIIPSGNKEITDNGTDIDVSAYATVSVSVSGGEVNIDTKTATASNYPTSLQFTGMRGQPKMFALKSTSQISSSGSTAYYYIIDMIYNGTTTVGNCFRIGSTRRVENITSGYSWSYSGTTLTLTTSASSRSSSPGAFNNGYRLIYVY